MLVCHWHGLWPSASGVSAQCQHSPRGSRPSGGCQLQGNVAKSQQEHSVDLRPSVHSCSPPCFLSSPARRNRHRVPHRLSGQGGQAIEELRVITQFWKLALRSCRPPRTSFCSVGSLLPGNCYPPGTGQRAHRNPEPERLEGSGDLRDQTGNHRRTNHS